MFGVPAFVDDLEVRLMAAHNADQNVCLVLFPEVSTRDRTVHSELFPYPYLLCPTAFNNHSSMSLVLRKLRLI